MLLCREMVVVVGGGDTSDRLRLHAAVIGRRSFLLLIDDRCLGGRGIVLNAARLFVIVAFKILLHALFISILDEARFFVVLI